MSDSGDDRRAHPRLPLMIPVEYKNLAEFFVDYALDISHGGMFIATDRKVEPGTEVEVKFSLPEIEATFEAKGKVVRQGPTPKDYETKKAPTTGIGIEFYPLDQESKNIIEKLWMSKIHDE